MFDDHDGVTFVGQAVQDADELFHVGHVQSDGRFLKEIKVASLVFTQASPLGRAGAGQFGDQFDSLGFAAGEGRAGLPEGEVAEAGFDEQSEGMTDFRMRVEKIGRFGRGHLHDIGDRLVVVSHVEGLTVVPATIAFAAGEPTGGEETHFKFDRALTEASFAASAVGVERKSAGGVAAHAGGGESGEELADFVKDLDVGRGGGAGGLANGGLVDHVNASDVFGPEQFVVGRRGSFAGGFASAAGHGVFQGRDECATEERRFARPRDAAGHSEATERNPGVDILQIVQGGAFQLEPTQILVLERTAAAARRASGRIGQELTGHRVFRGADFVEGPGRNDFATSPAGAGTEIDDPGGTAHGFLVVFDHEQ